MNPHEDAVTAFNKVCLIKYNIAQLYNLNNFMEYYWMSADELLDRIVQGVKAKSNIFSIINKFYEIFNKI